MDMIVKQLEQMSEFEINKMLAKILLDKQGAPYEFIETKPTFIEEINGTDLSSVVTVVCGFKFRIDYCNNWNDIMPISVELKLNNGSCDDEFYSLLHINTDKFKTIEFYDKKQQKAIACCAILVLMEQQ